MGLISKVAAVLLVAGVVAGCGGSSAYNLADSRSCLEEVGPTSGKDSLDYIAQNAPEAIGVDVGGTSVALAFERTVNDAKRAEAAYRMFAAAFDSPVADVLARKRNVVVVWDDAPTGEQRDRVEGCLR